MSTKTWGEQVERAQNAHDPIGLLTTNADAFYWLRRYLAVTAVTSQTF